MEYCVALANEGGGKIILGVTDRRPRSIVGTAAFSEPGRTEAGLYGRLSHRIPVEEIEAPEGRVLVVHVPSRLPGTAWQIEGRYLKRAGDDLAPMAADELRTIFAEIGPDFSAEPCPGATLADLSPEAIAAFRARWANSSGDARRLAWTDVETLANAELMVDGQVTYAALILLGTPKALTRHLAQAEVIFEYRSQEAAGPAADRVEYREGFLLFYDVIWEKINLRNDRQSYQEGFFLNILPTFDERSVREAIINAVAHRDYRLGGSVFVRQYAKRIEIVSPGGLPAGVTLDNIVDEQSPRNRRLAEALGRCGLIERAGQGVNLLLERAVRQAKPLPDFAGTSAHSVHLTLNGVMTNPDFVRFIDRLGEEALHTFSTYDFLALDRLGRGLSLSEPLKARLPGLLELGAVEVVGRGKSSRYILSQRLYEAYGPKLTPRRKTNPKRDASKALLEQHIRSQGATGASLADLCRVLPEASERMVRRLLSEMRDEGRVNVQGTTRWARWVASSKAP